MRGAKITLPNGRRFALVPRSGSYAIIWQALPEDSRTPEEGWHPINATGNTIGSPLAVDEPAEGLCCLVRDPVERFRSACARQKVTPEEGLLRLESDVHFWPLVDMGLLADGVKHFRFPDHINACAEWLGLETPVPQLNDEPEEAKPVLSAEQEQAVRAAYAYDISLWESLNNET
jgi:hypothetical protein